MKGGGITMLCGMQEQPAKEGYNGGMLGRLVLPCIDDHLVAKESHAFSTPELAPGERQPG